MDRKKSSKLNKKIIPQLVALIAAAVVLVTSVSSMFAWFVSNQTARISGMEVVVSTEKFDILVDRAEKLIEGFDALDSSGVPKYEGITQLKDALSADGYVVGTSNQTNGVPKVALELVNESVYEAKYFMMPGAYGYLSFYIKPNVEGDLNVDFSLEYGGFINNYDDDNVFNGTISPVDNATILNLLKGHVLFFTGRTGADYEHFQYEGLIDDVFHFSSDNYSKSSKPGKTDYYEVTLFWEWPLIYSEMTDNISTDDPAVTKKYPSELYTYINENSDYFFKSGVDVDDEQSKQNSYNDADQTIGDYIDYIVVYLIAQ